MSKLLILGAGGHGRVVGEAALATGRWNGIAYLDSGYPAVKDNGIGPVIGTDTALNNLHGQYTEAAIAIGDSATRLRLLIDAEACGYELPAIVHPAAWVSPSAEFGAGTVIMAGAVVQAMARIGRGCIVNTGASVDHDCVMGEGVHIAPGANVGGGVTVGDGTWIGIGSAIREGTNVGSGVMVGAGAAVVSDIPDKVFVAGVPAIERRD